MRISYKITDRSSLPPPPLRIANYLDPTCFFMGPFTSKDAIYDAYVKAVAYVDKTALDHGGLGSWNPTTLAKACSVTWALRFTFDPRQNSQTTAQVTEQAIASVVGVHDPRPP